MRFLFKQAAAAIALLPFFDAFKSFANQTLTFMATSLASPATGNTSGVIVSGGIVLASGHVLQVSAAYTDWAKETCYDRHGNQYLATFDEERGPVPCRRIEHAWANEPSNELKCEIVPDYSTRSALLKIYLPDGSPLGAWAGSTFRLSADDTLALMRECDAVRYGEKKQAATKPAAQAAS